MKKKVVLYGETQSAITDTLAEKVRDAKSEELDSAKRIFLNWIEFIATLDSEGAFGLSIAK